MGTPTQAVADAMMRHKGMRVVTNASHVARIMSANPDFAVSMAGVNVRSVYGGIVGNAFGLSGAERASAIR